MNRLVKLYNSITSSCTTKKFNIVAFFAAYVLFCASWIFGDLATSGETIVVVGKIMRLASYGLFALNIALSKRSKREWLCFSAMLVLSLACFFYTKEIYVLALTLMVMASVDKKPDKIFKITEGILIVTVCLTVALCILGVLENVISPRGGAHSDLSDRYSLGFFHSNVCPLLIFYITAYHGINRRFALKWWELLTLAFFAFVAFALCDSRMSFLATLLLIAFYIAYPLIKLPVSHQRKIISVSKYAVIILSVFTIALIIMYMFKWEPAYFIDDSVVTGRISLGFRKIISKGLHIFYPISYARYVDDGIVVDNGYLSTMIRYGLISIAILGAANLRGVKKFSGFLPAIIVFDIVCFVNFIDNDLLTYSCFPFLLAAFSRSGVEESYPVAESDRKLISVVMSTYNESFGELVGSIGSVLNQSYKNIELLIVNDNPENAELSQILDELSGRDERIRVIKNEKNIGLVQSLNKAIKEARGEYIARMDADDISLPDRLAKQVAFLQNNNLDFVASHIQFMNEDGTLTGKSLKGPSGHRTISMYMKWGDCMPHPTWLLKKRVYESLGGYRNIHSAEDYDFILRALKAGFRCSNLPEVTLNYRLRSSGISLSNQSYQTMTRYYLAQNKKNILKISERDLKEWIDNENNSFYRFEECKNGIKEAIRSKKLLQLLKSAFRLVINKNTYYWFVEKVLYLMQ